MDALFGWMGGKKQLRPIIAKYIPTNIKAYVEPFGGAGWVMFYKKRWANAEIYNDLDGRLTNLFMQIKWHPEAVENEFDLMINSRTLFKEIVQNKGITDIQKAARFLFLLKNSFGGLGEHFGTAKKSGGAAFTSRKNIMKKIRMISDRLDRVVVENHPYCKIFEMYDDPEQFFYCDPPYYHGATYKNSKCFDHIALRDKLINIEGRFLLSYDNCKEIKELYSGLNIIELTRQKGINRMVGDKEYHEVLISNYDLKMNQQQDFTNEIM